LMANLFFYHTFLMDFYCTSQFPLYFFMVAHTQPLKNEIFPNLI
jgi:hypothetical protein